MTDASAISVRHIRKAFADVQAVHGVSLDILPGEYVALLGPNGAGKTTLMEMIEGIQHPDEGEILINGKTWGRHGKELSRILGISLQETRFIENLKVGETLDLFASFYGLDQERTNETLRLVHLEEKRDALVKNLSGGQHQRLSLGIALINNPPILLLDEPTTGLDPSARREVWDILFRLRTERSMTMILTTHYMEEADYLCERIVILDRGKILAQGTVDELLSRNKSTEIIEFSLEPDATFKLPTSGHRAIVRNGKTWQITVDDIVNYLPVFLDEMKQKGLAIKTLECRKMTLDDLFISMTGRRLNV